MTNVPRKLHAKAVFVAKSKQLMEITLELVQHFENVYDYRLGTHRYTVPGVENMQKFGVVPDIPQILVKDMVSSYDR